MATTTPCIWRAPFTSVQSLQELSPGLGAEPFSITPDGATVFGTARAADMTWRAVRWNTTTLAITELETVQTHSAAFGSSDNGSVIVGSGSPSSGLEPPGAGAAAGQASPIIRWGSGGTAGSLLPPSASGITLMQWVYWGMPMRLISADGSVIIGTSGDGGAVGNGARKWVSGVNTNLPGLNTSPSDSGPQAICVSSNGSTVVGVIGQHNPTPTNPEESGYWIGTTLYRLAIPSVALGGGAISNITAFRCNSDASLIWGTVTDWTQGGNNSSCYWDSVTTPSGDGIHHGAAHVMGELSNTQTSSYTKVFWVADDPGVPVAVGTSPSGASDTHACKWVGTSVTDLVGIDTSRVSEAWGCNHDGSITVGWSESTDYVSYPVRWDASNAPHILPTTAGPDESFYGQAYGVSRDGSVIFGRARFDDVPPPDTTTLTTSEAFFQPQAGFVDFSSEATRRRFISPEGTPAWMESDGSLPFGDPPAVYLTTMEPPEDFTQNNGTGGGFPVAGDIDPADGPGCSTYTITNAVGPASNPQWRLTLSDDGGRTWGRMVKPRALGATGQYLTRLRWLKMGQSRERIVKLECTDPVRNNILGVYIDLGEGMG